MCWATWGRECNSLLTQPYGYERKLMAVNSQSSNTSCFGLFDDCVLQYFPPRHIILPSRLPRPSTERYTYIPDVFTTIVQS